MPTKSRSLSRRVPLIVALAALALALLAPQALARYVYTGNYDNETVSVIDTATNQVVGSPIPIDGEPYTMAIAPDGKTLYVGVTSGEDLSVVDTQTNQVTGTIPLGISEASTIAISPDGKKAYVAGYSDEAVVTVDLQAKQVVGPPIETDESPWGIAFSPDGKIALLTNEEKDSVSVIDTATNQIVGTAIPVGNGPINVIFSADGGTAYTTNQNDNTVSVINVGARQTETSIKVGENPWGIGLTPDGKKLFVSNLDDDTVSVIDTATRQVLGGPVPTGDLPYELAATPDGKSVYVANYEGEFEGDGRGVTVIDTATNQTKDVDVTGGPWQLAIVPDQSPTASFTAKASTKNSLLVAFNAINALDIDGVVAGFNWSFGDGATAANGGASTSHKYAKAGTYTVSLTPFDNEGCSGFLYTGRTAFCNGGGPATQSLLVKAPNNFKFGKLIRNQKKGTAKLKVKLPYAGKLTLSGTKVKKVKRSAKKAGTVTLDIRPKPKVKQQLIADGSLKVRIKVTFKPTGGKSKTKGRTLKLIKR
jgi:YVTN family beta-propeller protein